MIKGWTIVVALLLAPAGARAEDAALHNAQAGALLTYADTEVKLLFTSVSGREFDLDLARALLVELKRAVPDAKKSVDRSAALLTDKQERLKPDLEALRAAVKAAEDDVQKVDAELEKQVVAAGKAGEDGDDADGEDGTKKAGNLDWEPLKGALAWLYADLSSSRTAQERVAKKFGLALKVPPKPKGKHDD
jgi:hypothetical protein